MNDKMDLIFSPIIDEAPKLLISMKRFNHVYFGLYKGFDKKTAKEVIRYFWAEHNNGDSFFRCLVSSDDNLNTWTLDSIANNLIIPMPITKIQKNVLIDIKNHVSSMLDENGHLTDKFKKAMKEMESPFLILKNENSSEFSIAEHHILATLNATWRLDSELEFKVTQP